MKTLAPDKTVEERMGILEQSHRDCKKLQEERNKDMKKRVGRLEYLLLAGLLTSLITLASVWIKG